MKRDLSVSDFVGLELQAERDRRVSRAEQEDYMPPVGAPSLGEVLFLLAPIVLCLVGAGAVLVSFIR